MFRGFLGIPKYPRGAGSAAFRSLVVFGVLVVGEVWYRRISAALLDLSRGLLRSAPPFHRHARRAQTANLECPDAKHNLDVEAHATHT